MTSTIAGTVASVDLTVGQQVTGTGSGSREQRIRRRRHRLELHRDGLHRNGSTGSTSGQIEVIGTDSYIVNTTVDDTQIGQITDGDQVDITLEPASTTPVYGTVGSISLIGSQSSNVTTFPV